MSGLTPFPTVSDTVSNKLGHKNKQLILDISLENEFKENNKLHLDDIETLLHLLGKAIQRASERASFHILTLPETHIRMDIANLFDILSVRQPHEV